MSMLIKEITEQITQLGVCMMAGTPIILVRRSISLGLIKDLSNHAITVRRPLKWRKSRKERRNCWESNPVPLAFHAKCSATELQPPPAPTSQSCPYVACSSLWLIVDCSDSCVCHNYSWDQAPCTEATSDVYIGKTDQVIVTCNSDVTAPSKWTQFPRPSSER